MEEDNIIWKEMSTTSAPKGNIVIEAYKMKFYPSLYLELKEKCNPSKYMSPYDKEKVEIANQLYNELLHTNRNDIATTRSIREKAIQKLGITISTKMLYEKLLNDCNPKKFMDPYDFDTIQIANHFYSQTKEFRNDFRQLEKLEDEIQNNEALKKYYNRRIKITEKEHLTEILILYIISIIIVLILIYPLL